MDAADLGASAHPSRSSRMLLSFMVLFALAHVLLFVVENGTAGPGEVGPPSSVWNLFRIPSAGPFPLKHRLHLLALFSSLFFLFGSTAGLFTYLVFARQPGLLHRWPLAVVALVLGGIVMAIAWLAASLRGRHPEEWRTLLAWRPPRLPTRDLRYFPPRLLTLIALGSATVVALSLLRFTLSVRALSGTPALFLILRATRLSSNLSPAAPLFFLGLGFYCWSLAHLLRLRFLHQLTDAHAYPTCGTGLSTVGLAPLEDELRALLIDRVLRMPSVLLIVVLWGIPSLVLSMRFLPTFEGPAFDDLFRSAFSLLLLVIAVAFVRFVSVWLRFRRLLRRLAGSPLADAYDRMTTKFARTFGLQLEARVPEAIELEAPLRKLFLLANHFRAIPRDGFRALPLPDDRFAALATACESARALEDRFGEEIAEKLSAAAKDETARDTANIAVLSTQRALFDFASLLFEVLEAFWRARPLPGFSRGVFGERLEGLRKKETLDIYYHQMLPDDLHLWMRLAEDFVAAQVVTLLNHVLVQLRYLLTFVTAAVILLLLSQVAYPFEPHRLISLFVWGVIVSIATMAIVVLVQMERDELLSRIAGSTPGRIDWDWTFVSRMLVYAVVPILSIVLTQFPSVASVIYPHIQPLLRALR